MNTDIFHNSLIRKVFIVSGGRTATTLFGSRFGPAFDGIFSIHEPDRIDAAQIGGRGSMAVLAKQGPWRLGIVKALGYAGTRNLSLKRLQGKLNRAQALDWFLRDRRHLGSIGGQIYLEANYQLFGVIPELLSLPNSHVILLLRNPSSWVQSWLNKKWYSHNDWLTRLDILGMKRITPRNIAAPDPGWSTFSRIEKLCWVWGALTSNFLECQKSQPADVSLFRYEDLVQVTDGTQTQKERFLSGVFGRPATPDELRMYDNLIGHRDNASKPGHSNVLLPDWFLEQHRETLAKFHYD